MDLVFSLHTPKPRKIYQGMFILLIFCAAFFAHSEHYCQAVPEKSITTELHECYFCQQLLDILPTDFDISPTSDELAIEKLFNLVSLPKVLPAHVYPPLRAPPFFF
jgi:hypothetical protein